jgi:hypothetical protein
VVIYSRDLRFVDTDEDREAVKELYLNDSSPSWGRSRSPADVASTHVPKPGKLWGLTSTSTPSRIIASGSGIRTRVS